MARATGLTSARARGMASGGVSKSAGKGLSASKGGVVRGTGGELASPDGPGAILALIRSGQAVTRQSLIALTGLSRSTIAQRLELLQQSRFLASAAATESSGGRPAGSFQLNPDYGVLLLAATGEHGMHVGLADAAGTLQNVIYEAIDIADGPEAVLSQVDRNFKALLEERGCRQADVCGIGIGVPGPVAFDEGRVVRPPIMKGWDDYRVPDYFAPRYDAVVMVDNDANLMALGEHRLHFQDIRDLLHLTVGSGVGAGLIMSGSLQRGALGAAGDLGHWFMPPTNRSDEPGEGPAIPRISPSASVAAPSLRCRCGNLGCLEAYTSGWAMVRDLQQAGRSGVRQVSDVMALAARGDPVVLQMLARAGERIGDALTMAVSLLNPAMIVVGGELAHEHFLAALRQAVYRRAPPMATRQLQILAGPLGHSAALHGVAQMMIDTLFEPSAVDRVTGETERYRAKPAHDTVRRVNGKP